MDCVLVSKERFRFSWKSLKRLIREEVCWAAMFFSAVFAGVALFLERHWHFAGRGFDLSSYFHFGGGDAYLAVANGMFVNTGMIGYDDFYF